MHFRLYFIFHIYLSLNTNKMTILHDIITYDTSIFFVSFLFIITKIIICSIYPHEHII